MNEMGQDEVSPKPFHVFCDIVVPDVTALAWNPSMDLLASLSPSSPDGANLSVYRLLSEDSNKKLFTERIPNAASSLTWSPDGKYLAMGDSKGVVRIFECEGGVETRVIEGLPPNLATNTIVWHPAQNLPPQLFNNWFINLPPLLPVPAAAGAIFQEPGGTISPPPTFTEPKETSIMLSASDAKVSFIADGTTEIARIDMTDALQSVGNASSSSTLKVNAVAMAASNLAAAALVSIGKNYVISMLDTRILAVRRSEIYFFARHIHSIYRLVDYVEECGEKMRTVFKGARELLEQKIRALEESAMNFSSDGKAHVHMDLLLTCVGSAPDSVKSFIENQIGNFAQLARLAKTLAEAIGFVADVCVTRIQTAGLYLVTLVEQLQTRASHVQRWHILGLDREFVDDLHRRCAQLIGVNEAVLAEIDVSQRFLKCFFYIIYCSLLTTTDVKVKKDTHMPAPTEDEALEFHNLLQHRIPLDLTGLYSMLFDENNVQNDVHGNKQQGIHHQKDDIMAESCQQVLRDTSISIPAVARGIREAMEKVQEKFVHTTGSHIKSMAQYFITRQPSQPSDFRGKPFETQDAPIRIRWLPKDDLMMVWCCYDGRRCSVEVRRLAMEVKEIGCNVKAQRGAIVYRLTGDEPSGRPYLAEFYQDSSVAIVRSSGAQRVYLDLVDISELAFTHVKDSLDASPFTGSDPAALGIQSRELPSCYRWTTRLRPMAARYLFFCHSHIK
jgi:hypothetical protein